MRSFATATGESAKPASMASLNEEFAEEEGEQILTKDLLRTFQNDDFFRANRAIPVIEKKIFTDDNDELLSSEKFFDQFSTTIDDDADTKKEDELNLFDNLKEQSQLLFKKPSSSKPSSSKMSVFGGSDKQSEQDFAAHCIKQIHGITRIGKQVDELDQLLRDSPDDRIDVDRLGDFQRWLLVYRRMARAAEDVRKASDARAEVLEAQVALLTQQLQQYQQQVPTKAVPQNDPHEAQVATKLEALDALFREAAVNPPLASAPFVGPNSLSAPSFNSPNNPVSNHIPYPTSFANPAAFVQPNQLLFTRPSYPPSAPLSTTTSSSASGYAYPQFNPQ